MYRSLVFAGILLWNINCCKSSVDIRISPTVVDISYGTPYLDSVITITCEAAGDRDTIQSLIPFNIINGTYIPHSCVGSLEYQSTQRFSILPYFYTYTSNQVIFTTSISLSPISPSDNGLEVRCCFYNLATEEYDLSDTGFINVTILHTSPQTTLPNELSTSTPNTSTSTPNISISTTEILTTLPTNRSTMAPHSGSPTVSLKNSDTFIKSHDFYITIGAFSTVVFVLVILISILIIVQITRSRQIQLVPVPAAPYAPPRAPEPIVNPYAPGPAREDRLLTVRNNVLFTEV